MTEPGTRSGLEFGAWLGGYSAGQLDGLCGLYALINAIRLATHHHTGELGHGVWRDLLLALLGDAENVG
jgi:hypothetical protein